MRQGKGKQEGRPSGLFEPVGRFAGQLLGRQAGRLTVRLAGWLSIQSVLGSSDGWGSGYGPQVAAAAGRESWLGQAWLDEGVKGR